MIYLACPYWHDDPEVRQKRFELVTELAGILEARCQRVFSPITHSHLIERESGVRRDHDYWMPMDLRILAICDSLQVLVLDGWRESVGIEAEIDFASQLHIPIDYIDPADYDLS